MRASSNSIYSGRNADMTLLAVRSRITAVGDRYSTSLLPREKRKEARWETAFKGAGLAQPMQRMGGDGIKTDRVFSVSVRN